MPSFPPALPGAGIQPWATVLGQWDFSGHDGLVPWAGWVRRGAWGSTLGQRGGPQQPGRLMALASLRLSFPRGKFGEVHTCTEKQTGLKLAAKVIRKQGAKDKV